MIQLMGNCPTVEYFLIDPVSFTHPPASGLPGDPPGFLWIPGQWGTEITVSSIDAHKAFGLATAPQPQGAPHSQTTSHHQAHD